MKQTSNSDRFLRIFTTAVVVLLGSSSLSAEIVATQARVTTLVQELIDGEPASVTADDAEFGVDGATLPIFAASQLTSTDLGGEIVSLAQSFSEFTDPSLLDQPNPEEFAVEVGCYSNAATVSYSVSSDAVESRSLLFASRGVGAPGLDFGFDGTAAVESSIFLSGAVILWSTDAQSSPGPTEAELRITVTSTNSDEPVFESTMLVASGDSDGIEVATAGPLRSETVGLQELADLGLDQESLAVLAQVEITGELLVLVLPPQEHTYTYTVAADQELVLTATLEIQASDAPDGTGVAATLGRPFEELVEFMELGLPGVDGEAVQEAINLAVSDLDAEPTDPPGGGAGRVLCGAFGVESAAMMLSLMLLGTVRRRG